VGRADRCPSAHSIATKIKLQNILRKAFWSSTIGRRVPACRKGKCTVLQKPSNYTLTLDIFVCKSRQKIVQTSQEFYAVTAVELVMFFYDPASQLSRECRVQLRLLPTTFLRRIQATNSPPHGGNCRQGKPCAYLQQIDVN